MKGSAPVWRWNRSVGPVDLKYRGKGDRARGTCTRGCPHRTSQLTAHVCKHKHAHAERSCNTHTQNNGGHGASVPTLIGRIHCKINTGQKKTGRGSSLWCYYRIITVFLQILRRKGPNRSQPRSAKSKAALETLRGRSVNSRT